MLTWMLIGLIRFVVLVTCGAQFAFVAWHGGKLALAPVMRRIRHWRGEYDPY